jgi:hypothetical protein
MGGGVCGRCIFVVVMLVICGVVDATAMSCEMYVQDKRSRLRWRVAVDRTLMYPSRMLLETLETAVLTCTSVIQRPGCFAALVAVAFHERQRAQVLELGTAYASRT